MTDNQLAYLDEVVKRSKLTRKTFFGLRKTTTAEAAEIVLVAYAPALLAEIRRLRGLGQTPGR